MAAKAKKPAKAPAKRKKPPAKKAPTAAQQLARLRSSAVLVSVHGPFGNRAMIEVSTDALLSVIPKLPSAHGVTDGVEHDLASIDHVDLASLAATAIALAREIDSPGNSATSKAQCAKALNETMERIQAHAPAENTDDLDEIAAKRKERRAGAAASAGS